MEIMNVVSIIVLMTVIFTGAMLKRYTKKTLADMEGMSSISTARNSNIVAKF